MPAPAVSAKLDAALDVRYPATALALGVVGLERELEWFDLSSEEIARRLTALGILAGDVLRGTEQLEAAIDGEAA